MLGAAEILCHEDSIPDETALEIVDIFHSNYPPSHTEEERSNDFLKRSNVEGIQTILSEGRRYFVARESSGSNLLLPVRGFIEARSVEVDGGVLEQLAWIMVREAYRSTGVATLLHDAFIEDAKQKAAGRVLPTVAQLGVNKDNKDAYSIYKKWGYKYLDESANGESVLLKKDL